MARKVESQESKSKGVMKLFLASVNHNCILLFWSDVSSDVMRR